MTKIYLVRHAEAEGNRYRRIHGWYDSLITPNGYRQIEKLTERFQDIHIDAVYSSDLFRTMTTAGAIYKPKGLSLYTDPGLREINLGDWEDCPWGGIARTDGERLKLFNISSPDFQAPNGESLEQVRTRVGDTLIKLAAAHPEQTIAVFSHGSAIRNTLARFLGMSVAESVTMTHSDNTAVSLLEVEGDEVRVVFHDDNSHLPEELSTLAGQRWWKEKNQSSLADANMWYRPLNMDTDGEIYYQAREEAWVTIHGSLDGFVGEAFLADARLQSKRDPRSVTCAMLGDKVVGLIQMDFRRDADQGVGGIPFYYMMPEHRGKKLGVQLLGEAVSIYRPMGRDKLRLRCSPENLSGQRFYRNNGFVKVAEERGACGMLDILEKYIGYEEHP